MPPTPTPRPARARLAAVAVGLSLLAGLLLATAPPASAAPFAPNVLGAQGFDPVTGNGYHRLIWGIRAGNTGGGAVDAWQVERWNNEHTIKLATYNIAAGQGPDLTVPNMVEEVVYGYRVRAHNSDGWSGWSDWEPVRVHTALRHWFPFANETELVQKHYQDLLGRNPSVGETSTATGQITDAGTVVSFLNGLINRPERTQHRYPIIRLYLAFFDRAPDPGGLDYWVGRLKAGTASLTSAANFFAGSAEYKDLYGGTTNQQFVTLVYENVLDRNPAPNEVAYWKGELDSKAKSRGKVMTLFSESAEGKKLRAGDAVLADLWIAMLDEEPTDTLMEAYGSHIRAGGTPGDIALFIQYLHDYFPG